MTKPKKVVSAIVSILILFVSVFSANCSFAYPNASGPTTSYFTLDSDIAGYCGEARYNYVHSTGKLNVVGSGRMTDYVFRRETRGTQGEVSPWLNKVYYDNAKELYNSTTVNGETTAIKSLYIGDEVTNIGSCSFYKCSNLGFIDIGSSIAKIGSNAFYECNAISKINFRGDVDKWAEIDFNSTPLSYSGNLFINDELLTTANIDSYEIKSQAFFNCTSFTKCTLGSNVTKIGWSAFENTGLNYIIIPTNVSSIEAKAFYNCTNLSSISILNKNCLIKDSSETFPADTILYGYKGSTLEEYATNYGRTFVDIDNCVHDVVKQEIVEPTCTNRGYTQNICVKCGEKWNTDYKDKLSHIYTNNPSSEMVKLATCSTKAVYKVKCDICGNPSETLTVEVGEFNPNNHIFSTKPSREIVSEATCKSQAVYYVQCDYCDAVSSTKTVGYGEPLNHKFINYVSNNDATCVKNETKTALCEYGCDTKDTVTVPNTATGHKLDDGTVIQDSTCSAEGSMLKKCTNAGCDYQETVSIPKKSHTYVSVVTEPTCKEQGYTTYTCSECGDSYKSDFVNPIAHSFKDYTYNDDATCTADGTKTALCEYGCGTKDTVTAPNTARGHKFVDGEKYCTNGCQTENPNYKDPTPTPGGGGSSGGSTGGGSIGGGGGGAPAPEAPTETPATPETPDTTPAPISTKPATVKVTGTKAKTKALAVYWNKLTGVDGYQIQVATDKNFKKNKKTVTVAKQNASKKTVKNLKKNKKYYVRVRSYKIVNGKKVYGGWSKVKSVKTK